MPGCTYNYGSGAASRERRRPAVGRPKRDRRANRRAKASRRGNR